MSKKDFSNLSNSQINIVVVAVFLIVSFCAVYQSTFIPLKKMISESTLTVNGIQKQISNVESYLTSEDLSLIQKKKLQGKLDNLNKKFSNPNVSFKQLSAFAESSKIDVVSSENNEQELFLGHLSSTVDSNKLDCYFSTVSLRLKGKYENLIDYLNMIKKSSNMYVSFEDLKIAEYDEQTELVQIQLRLNLYSFANYEN